MKNPVNILAAIGLALGAIFGMAGTFVTQPHVQALFWGVDGAGLVMACALLAVKYAKTERDVVAAGFLVFAIAEAVILSGTAAGLSGSVPSFAGGTALWAMALILISIPKQFALPVRLLGLTSAILCRARRPNFVGRATASNLRAIAVLCVPLPCPNLHWLDLEFIERGPTGPSEARWPSASTLTLALI